MFEVDGNYFRMITPLLPLEKSASRGGATTLEKDHEGAADEVPSDVSRLIEGPASRPTRDMQGETIMPLGLDLSYFKRHGRINWDHGKSPGDIIGQPVRWKLSAKELYLWAILYKGIDKADAAYKLFCAGATLAWSVEGKVLDRDPHDPTRVLRAYVINVALTPNPVCQDTFARLSLDDSAKLDKALTTTTGASLMVQSLEGDGKPRGLYDETLRRHLAKALGDDTTCACIDRHGDAGRFKEGYHGAMSHFYSCCGATPDIASDLAGKHQAIARITGALLKGEA